jgi:hypothetical protein
MRASDCDVERESPGAAERARDGDAEGFANGSDARSPIAVPAWLLPQVSLSRVPSVGNCRECEVAAAALPAGRDQIDLEICQPLFSSDRPT